MIRVYTGTPALYITWLENGELLDFSNGYTFEAKLISCRDTRKRLTKTTQIYGKRDTRPNLEIRWQATNELTTLPPGLYSFQIKATNVNDTTQPDRYYRNEVMLRATL